MRIDLHTHSSVSDGTDTPEELVRKAAAAGLDVVALTDHDTFDGLDAAVAEGERVGVQVLRGMELSCSRRGDSVHLLAYGANPSNTDLAGEMVAQVGDSPSVGRPHIADAMIKAGHVRDREEAFERFLAEGGPAHVPRYAIELERGIDLVHSAGGVAVIGHPWGRGREHVLPPAVLGALVADHALDGVEVDHQDHDTETRAQLRTL